MYCVLVSVGLIRRWPCNVRLRNFNDEITLILNKRDSSIGISARAADSFKHDVNLEKGTISASVRALQTCGQAALGPEDGE
jgi:hypothetical protein